MKSIQPITLLALLIVSSCSPKDPPAQTKTEVPGVPNQRIIPPGTGYDSHRNHFLTGLPCVESQTIVNGNPIYIAQPVPEAFLDSSYSQRDSLSSNRFSSAARVEGNLGLFAISGELKVSTALVETDSKTSAFTTYTQSAGNVILLEPVLTDWGQGAIAHPNHVQRFQRCGNEYVYQVQLGARLHLGLEFAFASKEVKNNFNLKVRGEAKFGFATIRITILSIDKNFDVGDLKGTVRIVFEQQGGDQGAFLAAKKAIPNDCHIEGKKVTGTGGVTEAFVTGYQHCVKAYQRLVREYAHKEFPRQLKGLDYAAKDLQGSGYTALRYYTKPYVNAGFPELPNFQAPLPEDVKKFLEQDVVAFLRDFEQFSGELAALESIEANVSPSEVVTDLRTDLANRLGVVAGDADQTRSNLAQRYVDGLTIQTEALGKLAGCRSRIKEVLDLHLTQADHSVVADVLEDCGSDLQRLSQRMSSFFHASH